MKGIEVDLARAVVESMGGEVDIGPPTDGGVWGSDFDGDGVFNGMVGDLQVHTGHASCWDTCLCVYPYTNREHKSERTCLNLIALIFLKGSAGCHRILTALCKARSQASDGLHHTI